MSVYGREIIILEILLSQNFSRLKEEIPDLQKIKNQSQSWFC